MESDQSGLSCPRCGERLEDNVTTAVAIAIEELQEAIVPEPRVPIACPACATSLELVAGGFCPFLLGVEVWAEDVKTPLSTPWRHSLPDSSTSSGE